MVPGKIEKIATLIVVTFIIGCPLICNPDYRMVGLHRDSSWMARCLYAIYHTSVAHAAINTWCLLSVVFLHGVSWRKIGMAYLVAITVPSWLLSDIPTVGMSALCYTLLGMLTFEVRQRIFWLGYMTLYIAMGFLFPGVNAVLHLYCFIIGLLIGFLNMPICRKK